MTTPQQHVEVLRAMLRGMKKSHAAFPTLGAEIDATEAAIAALEAQASAPGGEVTEDKGPWRPGCDTADKWYVDSDDFTHDVRLYITGDFAPGQREAYARRLAETLNAALAARQQEATNGR